MCVCVGGGAININISLFWLLWGCCCQTYSNGILDWPLDGAERGKNLKQWERISEQNENVEEYLETDQLEWQQTKQKGGKPLKTFCRTGSNRAMLPILQISDLYYILATTRFLREGSTSWPLFWVKNFKVFWIVCETTSWTMECIPCPSNNHQHSQMVWRPSYWHANKCATKQGPLLCQAASTCIREQPLELAVSKTMEAETVKLTLVGNLVLHSRQPISWEDQATHKRLRPSPNPVS